MFPTKEIEFKWERYRNLTDRWRMRCWDSMAVSHAQLSWQGLCKNPWSAHLSSLYIFLSRKSVTWHSNWESVSVALHVWLWQIHSGVLTGKLWTLSLIFSVQPSRPYLSEEIVHPHMPVRKPKIFDSTSYKFLLPSRPYCCNSEAYKPLLLSCWSPTSSEFCQPKNNKLLFYHPEAY